MPDNWGFVAAAYAVAAVVLGSYWRMLNRRERELASLGRAGVRNDRANRNHRPSETAHPRPDPGQRPPLQ
jgi:hypothetical protein